MYDDLRTDIQSLMGEPTPLQTEADEIFRVAENAVRLASDAIADPAIQAGLVIPSEGPTPVENVTAARDALQAAINGAPRLVTDVSQLEVVRWLRRPTSTASRAVGNARNVIKAANQVRTQIDAVQNVFDETTNYGMVADRTAEGAAKHEARTGQRVGGAWHGPKCQHYATNLETIIRNLGLQKAALPSTVHREIDSAIARAEDRCSKLQEGADVWYERYREDPHVWTLRPSAATCLVRTTGR